VTHEGETMAWQPIETAPKNGTTVLVLFHNWNDPSKGRGVGSAVFHKGAWRGCFHSADIDDGKFWPPTHWMPLPAPPSEGPR
jgi:hypothetical protein